ncbi:MAG: hypothetical protein IJH87_01965 [Atopobiaceae bacterium]|nr:hypothetical protein [Atopobiaceae bacterium]
MSKNRKNLKMASLALMCIGAAVVIAEVVLNVVVNKVYELEFLIPMCVVGVASVIIGYLGVRAANVPKNNLPALIGFGILLAAGILVTAYRYFTAGISNVDDLVGLVFSVVSAFGLYFGMKVRERYLK